MEHFPIVSGNGSVEKSAAIVSCLFQHHHRLDCTHMANWLATCMLEGDGVSGELAAMGMSLLFLIFLDSVFFSNMY